MASAADLKFILSGGAANTDPAAALGGAISTAGGGVILSQAITASTIAGITYDDAAGNALGNGTMTYLTSGTTLQWTPPGGSIGPAVNVSPSGRYTVYGADGLSHVKITSVTGSLGGNASQNPTISNQENKLFDNVARADSIAGDVEYRCFYIKNAHASDSMTGVKLWINSDTVGADTLAIALDLAGVSGTADTVADENTAPDPALTFTSPMDEGSALDLGTLTTGQYYGVWIRRTVATSTTDTETADASSLKVRFL
jgi:hypothetical protein